MSIPELGVALHVSDETGPDGKTRCTRFLLVTNRGDRVVAWNPFMNDGGFLRPDTMEAVLRRMADTISEWKKGGGK